jgi:hypothetical protein
MAAGVSYGDVCKEITRVGLGDPRCLAEAGFKDAQDLLDVLYPEALVILPGVEEKVQKLIDLADGRGALRRQATRLNVSGCLDDALFNAISEKAVREAQEKEAFGGGASSTSRPSGQVRPLPEWKPARKRQKNIGGVLAADAAVMCRWTERLTDIMRDSLTPSWGSAFDSQGNPLLAMAGLVGKSRPSTVKKRVLAWERMARWLHVRYNRSWPSSATELVDYVNEKVTEGCSRTFPEELRSAVNWIESRSGLEGDEKFGTDALFVRNVERAHIVLGADATAVLKAPRMPLVLLAALELYVMDANKPNGLRVIAWCRLVKVFGVLRWDDLQRLRPRDFTYRNAGLVGRLTQTKTSGVGKKVRDLPLVIPKEAFVIEPRWQEIGFYLWFDIGDFGRDYFVPRLSRDLTKFTKDPCSARDLATLGTLVIAELTLPVRKENGDSSASLLATEVVCIDKDAKDQGVPDAKGMTGLISGHLAEKLWENGGTRLVPFEMAIGWTGHSERSTLPSLYASMGVAKSERDPLGRWSPSGSDDYVRTYKVLVKTLALRLRSMIQKGETFEVADEEDAVAEVLVFIAAKGNEVSDKTRDEAAAFVKVAKTFYAAIARSPTGPEAPLPEVCHASLVEAEEDEEVAPFIIACSKRGASRCLHKGGGCWRARGLVFLSFETCYVSPVPAPSYKTYCRDCWPREGPCQAVNVDGSSESSAESSDSS